ncbi:hypothetical protein FX988_04287 (plasmid) [Paraglaciecola mesophila]|uniref:Uncharacterized protein n=1 Tax=Paraglaciecola mesophila TaxID=197222 RepID=A0A857JPI6_9ALTE|nr:hypothetical protein FX988_04287 [Paraglaciecola mesophila]
MCNIFTVSWQRSRFNDFNRGKKVAYVAELEEIASFCFPNKGAGGSRAQR